MKLENQLVNATRPTEENMKTLKGVKTTLLMNGNIRIVVLSPWLPPTLRLGKGSTRKLTLPSRKSNYVA